jgi:hypothetical protein
MKLTYSFPSRSRPVKFFAALDNIRSMSHSGNYEVIAKLDDDDKQFTQRFKDRLSEYPEVIVKWGKSKNKVHAVNRDIEGMTGEILLCHSDDMVFIKKGFDDFIRGQYYDIKEVHTDCGVIKSYSPNGFNGLLHLPDGYAGARVCTYSIMHVNYYKRFGYIYNPEYISMWCDNEATTVAKMLNKYKYVNEQIFQHEHPVLGHVPKDEMYINDGKLYRSEEKIYKKRESQNFGL